MDLCMLSDWEVQSVPMLPGRDTEQRGGVWRRAGAHLSFENGIKKNLYLLIQSLEPCSSTKVWVLPTKSFVIAPLKKKKKIPAAGGAKNP